VEFAGGSTTAWFDIAYLTNGMPQHSHIRTVDGGAGYMPAHDAMTNNAIEIPDSATALRVELNFTSLTWRGRFSIHLLGSLPFGGRALKPVLGFPLLQDTKWRSKTEWSDEKSFNP